MSSLAIQLQGEELELLPEKAIYWKAQNCLILSDLHLGKAGHFRKHGIPVSRKVHLADIQVLESLILNQQPEKVILLGDLFHSFHNNEWKDFVAFLHHYDSVRFTLVEGNHDILEEYPQSLDVVDELELGPFSFTHIRKETIRYNISGHIHPGVTIRGRAKQSVTMACFCFADDYGLLPAFGQFTGIKKIRPKKSDRVYGVVDRSIIELT